MQLLGQLNGELRLAMAQLGCARLEQLGAECLKKIVSRL